AAGLHAGRHQRRHGRRQCPRCLRPRQREDLLRGLHACRQRHPRCRLVRSAAEDVVSGLSLLCGGSAMSHTNASWKRRGLTLIELLVLLAVLLPLLGLLMAATGRVREAAARAQSQNNLRRIAAAVHDYGDQHFGRLPPGPATWFPKKGRVANNGYGPCLFHMLPYLEQDPLYKSTRQNIGDTPVYAAWNAAGKSVKLFMAPGDPTLEQGSDRTSYLVNELALPDTGALYP